MGSASGKMYVTCESYEMSSPGPKTGGGPSFQSPHGPFPSVSIRDSCIAWLLDQPVRCEAIMWYSFAFGKKTAGASPRGPEPHAGPTVCVKSLFSLKTPIHLFSTEVTT